jgi:hypothetical protein
MTEAPTFVCKDCGVPVFDALGEVRERCHPCQWVANIPDPTERVAIHDWLVMVGAIDSVVRGHETADRDGAGAPGL